jgi:hypothetical protein
MREAVMSVSIVGVAENESDGTDECEYAAAVVVVVLVVVVDMAEAAEREGRSKPMILVGCAC